MITQSQKKYSKKIHLFELPEYYGRIGTGILELLFGIFILIPQTIIIGAIGIIILMIEAIISHVVKLGFKGKNLPLAISAIIALGCSIALLTLIY